MRKITFENSVNGLSATFSSDNPKLMLESFDGSSCGAEAITYRPLNYDGQRFVSSTLTARTIQFTVSICGKQNGRYSHEDALENWTEIQRVFVPGQVGTLTWTDGINTRFIKCRADSVPLPTEVLPFLFRVEFSLVADNPLWFDDHENVVTLPSTIKGDFTVYNSCGLSVPFRMDVEIPDKSLFIVLNRWVDEYGEYRDGGRLFAFSFATGYSPRKFTIDTAECTVTNDDGELCNHWLSPQSVFNPLLPGYNNIRFLGDVRVTSCTIRWRDAYLSVY